MEQTKLWANSGDSHSLGERAVWEEILPKKLADRMSRSEKFDAYEIVHLHELFDGVDPAVSHRIRLGAFKERFPHVTDPPAAT